MALGDGIRRSLATVSKEERDMLRDAILQLNSMFYPGARADFPAGHVSYWFKQDEIHQSTHVHGCPAFLPWHRELVNRFETLVRQVNPQLSLHYWDWNLDPSNMPDGEGGTINVFAADFMGNADPNVNGGAVGAPLLGAGFYDPGGAQTRSDGSPFALNCPNPNDPTTWSYPAGYNPADPPADLTRAKPNGAPQIGDAFGWPTDAEILAAPDFQTFDQFITQAHNSAHGYIGGNLGNAHISFRDPFVFFLHANIDRLWAMWQRQPGHPERLDGATAYGAEGNTKGSGDVEIGDPNWGTLSPLEPWAGFNAQNAQTGVVGDIWVARPWFAPENEQNLPGNNKNSQDPSVVFPPSYDTVPHSAYIVHQVDTFSDTQVQNQAAYPGALLLIYDGFTLNELGGAPPPAPQLAVTFDAVGGPNASAAVSVTVGAALTEGGGPDVPQRITFPLDVAIIDPSVFGTFLDTRFVLIEATAAGVSAGAALRLTRQPNPYMLDGNPYWLSTDVRVFKLTPGQATPGSTTTMPATAATPTGPQDAALAYINALLAEFRGVSDFNDDPNHPFEKLTTDETASQLEQSQTYFGQPVFNFAVVKVRYRANMTAATGVQVFFRTVMTMRSALDYVYVGANPPSINYTRSGAWPNAVPLVGAIDGEIASIPYFAVPRIDTVSQPMTAQPIDTPNVQTISAVTGQENVMFFGVWLDFNQPTNRFPTNPAGFGPFGGAAQPIPTLVNGLHQCLVAEVFFQPGGGADPIPSGANPATSDRLSQRNLSIDTSGNPGWPQTHRVGHSFMLKPSAPAPDVTPPSPPPQIALKKAAREGAAKANAVTLPEDPAAAIVERYRPDELLITWNDVPRDSQATLFFPEWSADTLLQLAAARQHPQTLAKVDDHTVSIAIADVTYLTLPSSAAQGGPGLLIVTLPDRVRVGQRFHADFHQIEGLARRVNGSFRFTVAVGDEPKMLPDEILHLAFLRYVAQHRSPNSRWTPIFSRWTAMLADKVRALGGDPNQVPPSLTDPNPAPEPPECVEPGECVVGKVACLRYDCFGDFEGFVLEDCGCERFIPAREPAIERIAHRACIERSRLRVYFDRRSRRILAIEAAAR